ncbi:hypothetical protein O181_071175 [Austropuccinia psidii MF-1]|uniref:Uncharacterized protein n=1 Tax=Austropuccinia psidii MF-1 TaxID=1389203 RepID=A0A9Q3I9S7_9BASI|nr:hypothetical protein [Austropuccinia psidii MF-1]
MKEYHTKKEEETKEDPPVASTSKPQGQPTSPGREEEQEKELEKTIFPKIQKDAMENVFNMDRTLMEFKKKEEQGT